MLPQASVRGEPEMSGTGQMKRERKYRNQKASLYLQIYLKYQIVSLGYLFDSFDQISDLTLFPPKTNIFVHSKNCTFSKKGLGHKGRCYSVCNVDTCK